MSDSVERWRIVVRPTDGHTYVVPASDAAAQALKTEELIEVVRADAYQGAVSPDPELLAFVRDFADWHTTADLNALAPRARDLLDRFGGQ